MDARCINIALLGKTGQGKSALGNLLLGLPSDCKDSSGKGISNWNVGDDLTDTKGTHFESTSCAESVTKVCKTLYVESSKLSVTDTPGFADSAGTVHVIEKNLQIIRQIERVHQKIQFDMVTYFCPFRSVPERADGYLREELELLYFYFGESIFRRMILAVTNPKKFNQPFDPEDITKTTEAFEKALKEATKGEFKFCPPIVYIPYCSGEGNPKVLEEILRVYETKLKLAGPRMSIKPYTCLRCACRFKDGFVIDSRDAKMPIGDSKCHPTMLPSSFTTVTSVRYENGTLTVSFLYDSSKGRIEKMFGKNQEKCINPACNKEPGLKGCEKFDSEFSYGKFKIKVFHCSCIEYTD